MKNNKKKSFGEKIIDSLELVIEKPSELIVYKKSIDIKKLRKSLSMTQREFADYYGFNIETLRKWEQGTYEPDKAVNSYLTCINQNPQTIKEILSKNK